MKVDVTSCQSEKLLYRVVGEIKLRFSLSLKRDRYAGIIPPRI